MNCPQVKFIVIVNETFIIFHYTYIFCPTLQECTG